ncbi:hypothetical protein B0J14DRAFT_601042 [Halenospora varia]|nr:hypothetical protein B0J14DRAFT_601042 [Halenospora varia]
MLIGRRPPMILRCATKKLSRQSQPYIEATSKPNKFSPLALRTVSWNSMNHSRMDLEVKPPAIGDVIDAFMALMVLRTCQQVEGGLPTDVKMKMYFNIVLDFGIGLVPFLGDWFSAIVTW